VVKRKSAPERAIITPRGWIENAAGWLLVVTTFLLPLKLGGLTGVPETTPIYTSDAFVLTIITWPPLIMPLLAALLLLAALPLTGRPGLSRPGGIYVGLWLLLTAVTFLGAVNASTRDFILIAIVSSLGFASLAFGVWLLPAQNSYWRNRLLWAITAGTVLTAVMGVQQYFSGFNDTLEYMKNSATFYAADQGTMLALMDSRRVFSTFSLPNSLAGYLILTGPVIFYFLWKAAGYIDPPKVSRVLILGLTAGLLLAVLIGTGSRSSMLMLGLTIIILTWALPFPRPVRLASAGIIILGIIAATLFLVIRSERGTSSMGIRFDYYYCALKMMVLHPFCGTGWGDFFHDYTWMKLTYHRETPHTAHNFILDFASQCGVPGLLASAAVLFYPLWLGIKRVKALFMKEECGLQLALLGGLLAWTGHSLTDVNLQVPASTGTAIILALLLLKDIPAAAENNPPVKWHNMVLAVTALVLGVSTLGMSVMMMHQESAYANLVASCEPIVEPGKPPRMLPPNEVYGVYRDTAALMPWSPFPPSITSRYMMSAGNLPEAEHLIRKAIELSPERASFRYRLAVILHMAGREEEALQVRGKAQELYPHFPDYRKWPTTSGPVSE